MPSSPSIPDHVLLHPIGRGAYGEVWLARNVMGAPRAVKIIWRQKFSSDRPYEREFAGIQRYEPVSRTTDGLVHVLHVGRNDREGYFYYVMELADDGQAGGEPVERSGPVRGRAEKDAFEARIADIPGYTPRTLRSDFKRCGRLPIADCLRVALDLVSGLGRLHERGLVHRDVKPGNIIFVNGSAKLADIGLVSGEGEGRTFVGTEGYIPPEGPGSPGADLYALGMVLYEASTGYLPEEFPKVPPEWFAEDTGTEALEFHEIVLKACEGAKERRYQSADQIHADLALLQSGQSVRRVRTLERRAARLQRLTWAGVVVVAIAVVAAFLANWRARVSEQVRQRESALLHEAWNAREKEINARDRAENAEREARQQLHAALFEQARALVVSKELGHRTRALEALERTATTTNQAELRRVAFAALALPDLRLERELAFDPALTLLVPEPSFGRIALARGRGPVTIRSLPDLEELAVLPASTNRDAYMATWSLDGRFLAVKRQHDGAGVRADWEIWNLEQKERLFIVGPNVGHASVTFHPKRPLLMVGHGGGAVTQWDLENVRQVGAFRLPNTPHALVYSPDGRRLATSYRVGPKWTLAFLDSTTLEVVHSVEWPESVELLTWHPEGRWICASGFNASEWSRGVRLIDAETGGVITLGEHRIKTVSSEFMANGQYLLTGGWDREIICWDLRTMRRAFSFGGTGYRHNASVDGTRCAVALPENVLQFYAFEGERDRRLSVEPGDDLQPGQFSPDGRWLVARDDRRIYVWDLRGNAPPAVLPMARKVSAFFSPDSAELLVSPEGFSRHGFLGRWRLSASENDSAPPNLEPLPVQCPKGLLRVAASSNELIMSSSEGVHFVALTNLDSGEGRTVRVPPGMGSVSPDSRWLAMIYDYSPTVSIYRLPEMEQVARIQTSNLVGFVTFSPTGDEMLVLNRSGVEWFDTTTWKCTRRQPGTPVSGAYAFYTPDGQGIWMVTHFRNAGLLDRRTLEPLVLLPKDVLPLSLSPDGRQLAFTVDGRRVHLRDMVDFRRELARLHLDW